jgi:signal transduction histidine kinase
MLDIRIFLFIILIGLSLLIIIILFHLVLRDYRKRNKQEKILDLNHNGENHNNNNGSQSVSSLWKVNKIILGTLHFEDLTEEVVNIVLKELNYLKIGYRISVLTLIDKKAKAVRRISFSPTPEALEILKKAKVTFKDIIIPLSTRENLLVKAIKDKKIHITHDLSDVFYPEKTRDIWRDLQQKVGIKTSLVFPLIIRGESIGAMIFSMTKNEDEINAYEKSVLAGFTDAVAVAIQNARLYKQLNAANEKLKDLDKRKDEFLNVAAHELRAPLSAVKGYISMIVEGDAGKVPAKIKDFLDGALEGADREVRLVNNLLNMSRIEEGRLVFQMNKVNLSQVAQTVFENFKLQAGEKKLDYKLELPDKIKDKVYVDNDRIHEVVSNFVSNAIKYTDKGSVRMVLTQADERAIRLEVIDTGYGMTAEEQQKLFTKFYRAESSAGKQLGTGLGLYITKLLIEKFGGRLGVESEKGKGSKFWFELPVVK